MLGIFFSFPFWLSGDPVILFMVTGRERHRARPENLTGKLGIALTGLVAGEAETELGVIGNVEVHKWFASIDPPEGFRERSSSWVAAYRGRIGCQSAACGHADEGHGDRVSSARRAEEIGSRAVPGTHDGRRVVLQSVNASSRITTGADYIISVGRSWTLVLVIKRTKTSPVVSEPSASVLAAWLRIALDMIRSGFPQFIQFACTANSPNHARGSTDQSTQFSDLACH